MSQSLQQMSQSLQHMSQSVDKGTIRESSSSHTHTHMACTDVLTYMCAYMYTQTYMYSALVCAQEWMESWFVHVRRREYGPRSLSVLIYFHTYICICVGARSHWCGLRVCLRRRSTPSARQCRSAWLTHTWWTTLWSQVRPRQRLRLCSRLCLSMSDVYVCVYVCLCLCLSMSDVYVRCLRLCLIYTSTSISDVHVYVHIQCLCLCLFYICNCVRLYHICHSRHYHEWLDASDDNLYVCMYICVSFH